MGPEAGALINLILVPQLSNAEPLYPTYTVNSESYPPHVYVCVYIYIDIYIYDMYMLYSDILIFAYNMCTYIHTIYTYIYMYMYTHTYVIIL